MNNGTPEEIPRITLAERAFLLGVLYWLAFALFAYFTATRWTLAPVFVAMWAISLAYNWWRNRR